MDKFIKFLVEAKRKTYASNDESSEKVLKDGTKELSFKDGNFLYRDRYYGSEFFAGEEVVFKNKKPLWVMNYSGRFLVDDCLKTDLYAFLKKSLKKVNQKTIFRGPEKFKQGIFSYVNAIKGKADDFHGEEFIYCKGKKVYELRYHGGVLKY